MGKSTISTGPFSIATLNYQRVDGMWGSGEEGRCGDLSFISAIFLRLNYKYKVVPPSDICWFRFAPVTSSL